MSYSLQPYGQQPARLLCPWDSPGKNTEWVAMPSSRASSWPRNLTLSLMSPALAGRFFTTSTLLRYTLFTNLNLNSQIVQDIYLFSLYESPNFKYVYQLFLKIHVDTSWMITITINQTFTITFSLILLQITLRNPHCKIIMI